MLPAARLAADNQWVFKCSIVSQSADDIGFHSYLSLSRCLGQVEEHLTNVPVKNPNPVPVQCQWALLSFENLTKTQSVCQCSTVGRDRKCFRYSDTGELPLPGAPSKSLV